MPASKTQPSTPDNVDRLVMRKGLEYGTAWLTAGAMLRVVPTEQLINIAHSEYFYPWFQIVGKLCRLLFNPTNIDTWIDIQGYARLAELKLRGKEVPNARRSSHTD